jgi:hypothetical protein
MTAPRPQDRSLWGMMIGRAATGLSRLDEYVRAHTYAADERPRQGRGDPCAAAPAGGPATQSGQARVHAERPHAAGRAPAPPPTQKLRQLRLLVRPDTILRWHRELLNQRHAATCAPKRRGRQRTAGSTRALGPAPGPREPLVGATEGSTGLTALGIKVAASTVWEILKEHGVEPAPGRAQTTGRGGGAGPAAGTAPR